MINNNSLFLTLDIETSTLMTKIKNADGVMVDHPIAVWLAYGVAKCYTYKGEEMSKCRFREWAELHHYLNGISQTLGKFQAICYVHNLGFEFDYLIKNISIPKQFLTNSSHSVISSTLIKYPNIQFRCSYLLSGYSLRKLGDIVKLPKLDSDYRTIFPRDKITLTEWEYCERDNDVVAKYITEVCVKEYGTLFNIPYTKTGRVRKVLHKHYHDLEDNSCKWDRMPDEDCIEAMDKAFNGGVVVSNPFFTDVNLHNVHSYDITSSYPFAMVSEKFPRSIKHMTVTPSHLNPNEYFIAKVKFINIRSKFNWQWLSVSKLENLNECEFFNGKLIYGKSCERYITNVDFDLIQQTYTFEYEIVDYWYLYDVDYLPECFIRTIKEIGVKKQRLKEQLSHLTEGTKEWYELSIEYMLAKNDFNSIYGMMVEKLLKPEFEIDENFLWHEKKGKYVFKQHMKRNFLFGMFITAYARKNLITAILKNCPETFVYCDTDSIKFIGENIFIDTNKKLPEFMDDCPELSTLGRFDYEGTYDEFKTFGAKKYCYKKNGKYTVVVAGLPKSTEYGINSLDDFCCGRVYNNCKLGKSYITQSSFFDVDSDHELEFKGDIDVGEWLKENEISTNGGVGLYPTSYKLNMTENDKFIIKDYKESLPEWLKNYKQQNGIALTEYFLTAVHTA